MASLNGGVCTSFVKTERAMEGSRRLLSVSTDEGIHTVQETDFVIVIDIAVGKEKSLRLEQPYLLRDQGIASVYEDENRNIGGFPPASLRKIPIPMRSAEAAQTADIMGIHANDRAGGKHCWRALRY